MEERKHTHTHLHKHRETELVWWGWSIKQYSDTVFCLKARPDKAPNLPPPVLQLYAKLSIKLSYFVIGALHSNVMVISTRVSFVRVIITCLLRYSGKCFLIIRCLFAAQLTGKLITCLINYCSSYISYAHHNVVNPINMENSSVGDGERVPLGTLTCCQCHSGSLDSCKMRKEVMFCACLLGECNRETCPPISLYFLCGVTTQTHSSNYNETGSAKTLNRTSLLYHFL